MDWKKHARKPPHQNPERGRVRDSARIGEQVHDRVEEETREGSQRPVAEEGEKVAIAQGETAGKLRCRGRYWLIYIYIIYFVCAFRVLMQHYF